MPETWKDVLPWLTSKFSPKVVIPFLLLQIGNVAYAFLFEGGWDWRQTVVALLVFAFAAIGAALPPAFTPKSAPTLRQEDVEALAHNRELQVEVRKVADRRKRR